MSATSNVKEKFIPKNTMKNQENMVSLKTDNYPETEIKGTECQNLTDKNSK